MDNQSKVCRACNGNPDFLKCECYYCEIRAEWYQEHIKEELGEEEEEDAFRNTRQGF